MNAWACTDCAHLIANGDTPEGWSEAATYGWLERIHYRAAGQRWGWGHDSGEDSTKDFSWEPCDVCGSDLGGSREAVHLH